MTQLLHRPRPARREDTLRVLAGVALAPAVAGVAMVAVAVLLILLVGGGDFAGAPAITSAVWLAAHQVPLRISGQPLGVLPLLPTLVLVAATARSVRAAVRQSGWSGDRVLWLAGAAVAGPVVVSLGAVGLLAQRPSLLPVEGVSVVPAVLAVLAVHAVGAVLGAAVPSGRWGRLRDELPAWAWRGLLLAPRALAGLLGAGALLLTASLVLGFGTVGSLYGPGASVGTVLGLTAVSLLYLPNAVVAATSLSVGPGVEVGRGSVTAVGVVGGPVPPVPLLGGLPGSSTSWLWLLVLVLPAVVGVLVGRDAARRTTVVGDAARSVLVVAAVVGVALGVAGWLAGGRLGSGVFDPVHVPAGLLGVLAAVWIGAVGSATAAVLLAREARSALPDPVEDEVVDEAPDADTEVEAQADAEPDAAEAETEAEPEQAEEPEAEPEVADEAGTAEPGTAEADAAADTGTTPDTSSDAVEPPADPSSGQPRAAD